MEAGSFTQQVFGQTLVELRLNHEPHNQLMAFFFFKEVYQARSGTIYKSTF